MQTILRKSTLILALAVTAACSVAAAQDNAGTRDDVNRTTATRSDDDGFDMGWLGLIGLAGLAGLMPRKDRDHHVGPGNTTRH